MPQRVLVADDHQIVRQSVRALLESQGFEITGEAANGLEAVELAQAGGCDVAILDLSMPELDGIEAAREILATSPDTSAILLTVHAEEHIVFNALQAGIRGYVVKTQAAEELVRAIGKVSTGAIYLSPGVYGIVLDTYLSGATILEDPLARREREVLQLVAEGKSTKQIAAALNVRVKTIESYRTRIMDKLKIRTTAGLVRYAIRRGLITP